MTGTKTKYLTISNFTALTLALILFLFHVILIKYFIDDEIIKAVVNNGLQTVECLLAAIFLYITSRKFKEVSQTQSRTWLLFSLAALSNALGNIAWVILVFANGKVPFPSYPDIGFILFYVFFIWGIFNFPMIPLRNTEKTKLFLDLFILLISFLLIFAAGISGILIAISNVNPGIFSDLLAISTALSHPILDIILIWTIFYFFYRREATNRRWVLGLLLGGLASLAISDFMTNYELVNNTYVNGSISDYGSILAFLLFALAGIRQINLLNYNGNALAPYDNKRLLILSKKIVSYLPFIWSLFSYLALIWLYENRHMEFIEYELGGVTFVILLTFIRQIITLKENYKLTNELENEIEIYKKELIEDSQFQNELLRNLAQSESKYKDLIENSLQGVLIFQNDHIIFANKRIEEILGYSIEEIKSFTFNEYIKLLPEEGLRFLINNIKEQSEQKDAPYVYHTEFKHKNGNIIWLELITTFVTYNNEKAIQIALIDITERKTAEEELRKSEEKYRVLFENNLNGIVIFDVKSLEILDFNDSLLNLYGYEPYELLGKSVLTLSAERDLSLKTITDIIEQGQTRVQNRNHRKKDGTIFPVESMIIAYNWHSKRVACAIIQDVTEKIAIEEKRKELTDELIEINNSKDKFFSIIAHDLKSPFQGLLGFSEILDEDYYDLSEQDKKRFVENIRMTSKILYTLVENLLQWSRLQTGRIQYNPEDIDIHSLIKRSVETLKGNIQKKKISLENKVRQNNFLRADEIMIQQVIQNLLSNAIKFTPAGGRINIFDERIDGHYKFVIEDNGVGIPEEIKSKLFNIDSHYTTNGTENEEGTGLGLILCKEFVERNGGRIWVESEEGKGSRFIVEMPVKVN